VSKIKKKSGYVGIKMAHTRSFSTYFADITAFLLLSGLNFIFDSLASNT